MSNQIKYQCWSFKPGSSVPQSTAQFSSPRHPSQSGQSARVAGHPMGGNFIPASEAPGGSSDEPPAIGQRGVNGQGRVSFKITTTSKQQVIEGEAPPEFLQKLAAEHFPDFQVFSPPFHSHAGIPCNDPQCAFPTPPATPSNTPSGTPSGSPNVSARQSHNTNNPYGGNGRYNTNQQAMAQGRQ